jgi:hypothetical protein
VSCAGITARTFYSTRSDRPVIKGKSVK